MVNVFIKKIDGELPPIICVKRREYLEGIQNPAKRRASHAVWALLECAMRKTYNLDPSTLNFTLSPTGKWVCDDISFSLSHSANTVAVAISSSEVGVDIQEIKPLKEGVERAILNEYELPLFYGLEGKDRSEYLIKLFTQKEAIFKLLGGKNFIPSSIQVGQFSIYSQKIGDYFLSVATKESNKIEVII